MALGIDIYRYQTVTDWNAVKRHGVSFVYVKGTDGGGPAVVRADNQVRGAQSVGLPVGLYHYAQLSPSPEVQADILTAEVHRLGATGLPPALDLEDPHRPGPVARDFARRFLTRLRGNGFGSVSLYANTSMLSGITADTIGVPGTIVWAASYGPNDGRRHSLTYGGRVDIHQYTSVGLVPGISGQVDLNESLTELPGGGGLVATQEEIQAIAKASAEAVWETHRKHLDPANPLTLPMWIWTVGANMGAWAAANRPLPAVDVDEAALAEGIAVAMLPALKETLAELDNFDEADAELLAQMFGRKLAAAQVAAPTEQGGTPSNV